MYHSCKTKVHVEVFFTLDTIHSIMLDIKHKINDNARSSYEICLWWKVSSDKLKEHDSASMLYCNSNICHHLQYRLPQFNGCFSVSVLATRRMVLVNVND